MEMLQILYLAYLHLTVIFAGGARMTVKIMFNPTNSYNMKNSRFDLGILFFTVVFFIFTILCFFSGTCEGYPHSKWLGGTSLAFFLWFGLWFWDKLSPSPRGTYHRILKACITLLIIHIFWRFNNETPVDDFWEAAGIIASIWGILGFSFLYSFSRYFETGEIK